MFIVYFSIVNEKYYLIVIAVTFLDSILAFSIGFDLFWVSIKGIEWSQSIYKCSQNLSFARIARKN